MGEAPRVKPLSRDQGKSVFSPVKIEQLVFKSLGFQPALMFSFGSWGGSAFPCPVVVTACVSTPAAQRPPPPQKGLVAAFLALGRESWYHSKERYLIFVVPFVFSLQALQPFLSVNFKKSYIHFPNVLHNTTSYIQKADSCPLRYSLTA